MNFIIKILLFIKHKKMIHPLRNIQECKLVEMVVVNIHIFQNIANYNNIITLYNQDEIGIRGFKFKGDKCMTDNGWI